MFGRIGPMLVKEFIQALRDPRMKGVVFAAPVIQLLIFGYAVSTEVKNVATAIRDDDNTVSSRELVSRFEASPSFTVVGRVARASEAADLLDSGRARLVLVVERGFEAAVLAGRPAAVQALVDGTDSTTASVVMSYSAAIVAELSEEFVARRAGRLSGPVPALGGVELVARAWFNPNLESRPFYLPGVIAMLVVLITLMLTSMAIVREKEMGTMEQIMVTPIRPVEFIAGKSLPFLLIAFVDVAIAMAVAVFWFEVPVRGFLPLLFVGMLLFVMTTLGIGLLISTVSATQQQAMMTTFFFFIPAMLLSGFAFPIRNMPEAVQVLTYANPLRYFLVIIRGVFLKGVGFDVLWGEYAGLAVIGTVTLAVAVAKFKKTLA
jgi:ABC-2 type transport system permease protein